MMNRIGIGAGAVLLAVAATACGGGSEDKKKTAAGGSGGAAGMPGLMLGGSGGSVGDTGPATIPLTPPAKINLEACKSISDDLSSQSVGDCFICCNQAGLVNSGFFEGSCACGAEIEGLNVCAAQASDASACDACCQAANYSSSGFSPGGCECDGHTSSDVCAPQTSRANCAVCCINAGYVSSVYAGACHCLDG